MRFIGRANELDYLESSYADKRAQLVIMYGRRRVGKTETLAHFAAGKPHLFFSAQSATKDEQLAAFSKQMFAAGAPAARYIDRYPDWQTALSDLVTLPRNSSNDNGRRLVIFDEFPYLVKSDPSLPSVLQNLWDRTLQHEDIMIILCGSAMSFIEKEILSEKSPLYGRATGILKMQPMPYWDATAFLPDYTDEDKTLAYAILGGIPHYLLQFDPDDDLQTNIENRILRKGTALYSEVEFLMHQEFRETATYNSIIQAVALGATQLNDIAQKTLLSPQKASTYIANLIEVGLLEREFPANAKTVEFSKGMRGLYHISDNFFRFWFAFVFPNRSNLEFGDIGGVYRYDIEPQLHTFAASAFEHMCADWLRRCNAAGTLPFHANIIGRWWNSKDEIDVVAGNRDSTRLLLGECKFRNQPIDMRVLQELRRKGSQLRGEQRWYYLFSLNGFTESLRNLAEHDDSIRLIDMKTLFGAR
ncbi:ATP-binding protein [Bifidobacterium callimiconis]|uniref:ATPase AAA n=1 Tax=Bifidobacterium callimiconis TaxID=2306973 RepID=A0A430F9E2_9BIFI|nr:ATP-binding protein [Bifidobacterium callimiconis]MBT1177003.1 ATP-binding protein [Bifidobacterium callimiconis]RSX49441.1 ATPase AAA [Bifidobacterium callimiconis]